MNAFTVSLCRTTQFPHLHSPSKDPNAWNSILKNHAKLKNDRAILASYSQMESLGIQPTMATLPLVLKACSRLQDVEFGKRIHSDIIRLYFTEDVKIRTALIDFYCKCGFLDVALELFEEMPDRDLVSWNAMISGYVGNQKYYDALLLFFRLSMEGLKPSSVTLVSLITACAELLEFRLGRAIHCYCLRNGFFHSEVHLGTALIGFYSRFDVRLSHCVFDLMPMRNVVSWNAMISEYFDAGADFEALQLFVQMMLADVTPDSVTFLAVLQSCGEFECLEMGKLVHQLAIKCRISNDKYVENAMITMYGKCGNLESACDVFEKMISRDLASWNAMLFAYKNCKCYDKAFDLFKTMNSAAIEVNTITISTMLSLCAESGDLEKGEQLHAYVMKTGKEKDVGNALLSMYAVLDQVFSALKVFSETETLDTVSWNLLIMALMRNQLQSQALNVFKQMQQSGTKSNSYTMVSLLRGCKDASHLITGKSIHGYSLRHYLEFNSSLCTALTDMYMDCGQEVSAMNLFWSSSDRDVISWNAMIASYDRNGRPGEALQVFYKMQSELRPNSITMINVLPLCAEIADLLQGRCLHAYIIRRGLDFTLDISVENALLTMYAKCGCIRSAVKIFDALTRTDIVSWNAMIAAYGMHGCGEDALQSFYQMLESGERPTSVTFTSILSACSHSGLTDVGLEIFKTMHMVYRIEPDILHYSCMVDLLGRAGFLDKAGDFIQSMPLEPDPSLWRAHLASYNIYPDAAIARYIGEKLIELDPTNIGNYMLLSNLHAAAGSWEDVNLIRSEIKEMGLKKTPGVSWIVIRSQVHSFTAGDTSHPMSDQIHETLRLLFSKSIENGDDL
ncbi:TPR-like protein [Dioscorea alata]|uniref:TPR-like protein n=1 Tax=Dioscorea alata TaxID=55571 RepID=A0ACB7WR77_DIOAL|nr:TPR-like protein [Dioscorea alata]